MSMTRCEPISKLVIFTTLTKRQNKLMQNDGNSAELPIYLFH